MPKLQMLSPSIMEKFVLPQLLTQEFFAAEGFDIVYRTLFTPQPPRPLISEETYRAQVMPFMIKLWTYRQADIRMTVFRLFEVYLKAVVLGEGGSEVLGQIILPEVIALSRCMCRHALNRSVRRDNNNSFYWIIYD